MNNDKLSMLELLYGQKILDIHEIGSVVLLVFESNCRLLKDNTFVEIMECERYSDSNSDFLVLSKGWLSEGAVDKNGEIVIPFKYFQVKLIENGFSAETLFDKYQIYNTKGECLLDTDKKVSSVIDNKYFITYDMDKEGKRHYGVMAKGHGVLFYDYIDKIKYLCCNSVAMKSENAWCIFNLDKLVPTDWNYSYVNKLNDKEVEVSKGGIVEVLNLQKLFYGK